MQWKKDGQIFAGRLVINGRVSFVSGEPDPALMRSLGWEEYTPPAPQKRYSKLKVIRKLGETWPAKKLQLEQAGLWDEFDQSSWLAEDDPAFAAVYATLTDAEKAALEECQYDN